MIKLDNKLINRIASESRISKRKRMNYNFHKDYSAKVQRLINVVQPKSIVEPHKHEHTFEVFIALKGRIEITEYDNKGKVRETYVIEPNGDTKAVEVAANVYHSMKALEPDSVVYMVMEGPYNPKKHKLFK